MTRRQVIMDAVEKKAGLVRFVTPGTPLEHADKLCGAAADWIIKLQTMVIDLHDELLSYGGRLKLHTDDTAHLMDVLHKDPDYGVTQNDTQS